MSKSPKISMVVAVSENLVIGKDGWMPWNIPSDLKHFKKITAGHPIIMGRKTFESIGKPLPKRTNIVVTRDLNYSFEGVKVVSSLKNAILEAGKIDQEEIFVIGGGQIYKQALELADKLYLTLVQGEFEGDTFFPEYRNIFTKTVSEFQSEENGFKFSFLELEK
jgi:dihydrofolate reductase